MALILQKQHHHYLFSSAPNFVHATQFFGVPETSGGSSSGREHQKNLLPSLSLSSYGNMTRCKNCACFSGRHLCLLGCCWCFAFLLGLVNSPPPPPFFAGRCHSPLSSFLSSLQKNILTALFRPTHFSDPRKTGGKRRIGEALLCKSDFITCYCFHHQTRRKTHKLTKMARRTTPFCVVLFF